MAGYTSAMCGSAKAEKAMAMHCFAAPVTPTGTLTSGQTTIGSLSSSTGLVHGMPVSGTGVPAATFILNNAGTWLLSQNATASNAGVTLTCAGDPFWIALGVPSPTGTFGASSTNYSQLGADEVTGTNYSAGGQLLATNISPTNSAGNAYWQWSVNPSWAAATISTGGAMIYNKGNRGPTANRANAVFNFGGPQTVTVGTLTLLQPTNGSTTSLLQLN